MTGTTTAVAFVGESGAIVLSLIAFTIVFLVLGGLTLVIYAMRLLTGSEKKNELVPSSELSANSKVSTQPSKASCVDDTELVAVITAALIAELGSAVSIRSITPSFEGTHEIARGIDGWMAVNRIEGLQGALRDTW